MLEFFREMDQFCTLALELIQELPFLVRIHPYLLLLLPIQRLQIRILGSLFAVTPVCFDLQGCEPVAVETLLITHDLGDAVLERLDIVIGHRIGGKRER